MPEPARRVVVTGIGLITPFGLDRESSWRCLQSGASATRWLDPAPISARGVRNVDVADPDWCWAGAPAPLDENTATTARGFMEDPVITLAVRAARVSVADAGLDISRSPPDRIGCVIGTSKGGIRSLAGALKARHRGQHDEWPTELWTQFFPNAPAAAVSQALGLAGPSLCPVAACATGLISLQRGVELIRDGVCDAVLAGSSDASLLESVLASFSRLGVLAKSFEDPATACRPFDRNRCGFVIGEGAAVLLLERLDRAAERGASPYAEWLAGGHLADPSGLTALEPEGRSLSRLLIDVLARAELTTDEVDYANLHGSATLLNDRCETRAVKTAFGPAAERLCCSGLKGAVGHLLGAAGSVEMAVTLLAMRDGVVPPTVNLFEPDEQCDLDYTPRQARRRRIEHALKVSMGFGGHVAAAVIRRFPDATSRLPFSGV